MSDTTAGILFIVSMILALALAYRPLGDYMYRIVTSTRHLWPERVMYRLVGVDADGEQSWGVYARSVLAFSAVSILFLYAFMRLQSYLWLSLGLPNVFPSGAWNTAVSFTTNTNWQWYSGESTMGHLVQMAGLAVQNFVSAAVGIAVAVALVRGFARKNTDRLGNFWVDLVRIVFRLLLPIAVVGAVVLIAGGAVQNLSAGTDVQTLAGAAQHITGGPVASQEAIKDLGTNGGGFYNANSSHPFENPTSWTNWIEIFLLLVISVLAAAHVRPDGRPQPAGVRDRRRDGDHGDRQRHHHQCGAGAARRHGADGGRRRHRGHRVTLRGAQLGHLRRRRPRSPRPVRWTRSTTPTPRSAAASRSST